MQIFLPQHCKIPHIIGLAFSVTSITLKGYAAESRSDTIVSDLGLTHDASASVDGTLYALEGDALWRLEQIASPVFFRREKLHGVSGDVFGYFRETESYSFPEHTDSILKLKKFDVCLTIPGYAKDIKKLPEINNRYGNSLNEAVRLVADAEFAGDYIKNNTRRTVGTVMLDLSLTLDSGIESGKGTFQPAVINVVIHNETQLCVVEIWAPNLLASAARMLSYYCSDQLNVLHKNTIKSLTRFIEELGIRIYEDERSLVFAYDELDEDELLNILVNEEIPMGRIMGSQFKAYAQTNLAQYDTARVCASETTMVEMVKECAFDVMKRINAQAIELFFVEMLLLQDAAVSKMNQTVKDMVIFERTNPYSNDTKKVINDMVIDMSHAINFADYKQFYFPTVRVSAEKVSQAFGISAIENKLSQNKALLQQMIDSNTRKLDEKENKIKNVLLSVLSFISGMSVIENLLKSLIRSDFIQENSYFISIGLMLIGTILYWLILKIVKKRLQIKIQQERMRGK